MPFFVAILAPGFIYDTEKFSELVKLQLFSLLILISVSSIFASILNSHNKFALSAAFL